VRAIIGKRRCGTGPLPLSPRRPWRRAPASFTPQRRALVSSFRIPCAKSCDFAMPPLRPECWSHRPPSSRGSIFCPLLALPVLPFARVASCRAGQACAAFLALPAAFRLPFFMSGHTLPEGLRHLHFAGTGSTRRVPGLASCPRATQPASGVRRRIIGLRLPSPMVATRFARLPALAYRQISSQPQRHQAVGPPTTGPALEPQSP